VPDTLLRKLREYVTDSSLQFSYKLVLLKAMLPRLDADGLVELETVVQAFKAFYEDRLKAGLPVDQPRASINRVADMSIAAVRSLILDNPFAAYSRAGLLRRTGEQIGFVPELWAQMTLADREELARLVEQRLDDYYEERVVRSSLNSLLNEVLESYPEARSQRFNGSVPIVKVLTRDLPVAIADSGLVAPDTYKIIGSAGQGNWAAVPWVAVLDTNITESIQSGVYVVYLFGSDMDSVYLCLMLGVTETMQQHPGRSGLALLRGKAADLRKQIDITGLAEEGAAIGQARLAQQYEAGIICYIKYDRGDIPDDGELLDDLEHMLKLYAQLKGNLAIEGQVREVPMDESPEPPRSASEPLRHVHGSVLAQGFQYTYPDLCNFYLCLRTKPFVILAGISGTGKSLLPRLFARAISAEWRPIAVRPDWNDGSDLLGYVDLEGNFRPGELTGIIEESAQNPDVPYLVVLDEMNLARVEHYLSDLLSVMETRKLKDGRIVANPILKPVHFRTEADRRRYSGLGWPDNLYLVGTVNMDETTHPFSKKVLDRANTIEFSEVDLKGYQREAGNAVEPIRVANSQFRGLYVHLADALAVEPDFADGIVDQLVVINDILQQANLHVGYRVRDEIVIYMVHNRQLELLDEAVAFDYQLLQKILPRIQGSSQRVRRVLIDLLKFCGGVDLTTANDDLLARLEEFEVAHDFLPYPRSAAKLAIMLRRFEEDGFTSYWI
jgi:5-methylcytosine-specific restriction protein B